MTEKNEIKKMGGKAQKNSGRGAHDKGDATLGPYLVDIKEYKKSFSVSRDVWAKICTDAFKAGRKEPALNIVLGEGNEKVRLWVIEDSSFQYMLEMTAQYEDLRDS